MKYLILFISLTSLILFGCQSFQKNIEEKVEKFDIKLEEKLAPKVKREIQLPPLPPGMALEENMLTSNH